jgi:uncharacterized protein (DUF362 family)
MLISRRTFLKTSSIAGTAVALNASPVFCRLLKQSLDYYGVHPFIDAHPDAVFILRTNVDVKTNSASIKDVGLNFGRSVFVHLDPGDGAVPIDYKVALKPNITCRGVTDSNYTRLGTMGIVTDSFFVEGIIESIKELGVQSNKFYIRETNCATDYEEGGYISMAARTGADIRDLSANVIDLDPSDVQWKSVDGVWFNKIPFLAPVNSPQTFLVNIAKLKTHGMGMTLCAKNMQGSIAHNYQEHCALYSANMNIPTDAVQPDAKTAILANYNRHVSDNIPRWDRPGDNGGIWQETWATRCLDTNSVTHPNLHIIEGIYGRDGNFIYGPGANGLATDYMTNYIIFGKNPFHVDIIGHWLGGHEPGNFGLFHMAIERGQASILNPAKIPLYEWQLNGSASVTPLENFTRTPLKTYYLQRDYNGQTEDYWHLVNEPYNYPVTSAENLPGRPDSFVLYQNFPNPFNPSTAIQFSIPQNGNVRIEICDIAGTVINRLTDKYYLKGTHLVSWNTNANVSGIYFYRMFYNGSIRARKMLLLK